MKMNENNEENSKGSINRIYPIIGENEQKQTINDFKNEVNIVPIKLKLSPELLSRNKTNLDSLSKRLDSYGEEISKMNKKHKVSFIDQVSSNKNIAQIIYIDDQSSAQDCKKNAERYNEILRKQQTNISEQKNDKKNEEDMYKIKRPKRSKSHKANRYVEKVSEFVIEWYIMC